MEQWGQHWAPSGADWQVSIQTPGPKMDLSPAETAPVGVLRGRQCQRPWEFQISGAGEASAAKKAEPRLTVMKMYQGLKFMMKLSQ